VTPHGWGFLLLFIGCYFILYGVARLLGVFDDERNDKNKK
jgi:hypothetical protein